MLGFSPATLLERCAESARDIERLNREREGALAGPRLATRIILALPIGALGLTALLGLNPLAGLVNGLFGWLLLVLGGLLLWCGRRWMVRLVNTASRGDPAPGFAAEVLAALLDSGIAL
ncbi:MAG TPA: hypothetical protein VK139_03320, partial [Microbacteriaceae bacterium]|nr:hypothetical protein [Microbacteriaceae bacterium]